MRARPPAMQDVARRAGVSAQTVSRALSGHPNVTDDTRERVRTAARELGYRRNPTARTLVTGRSNLIGVVTLSTGFYSRLTLMSGIEHAAAEAGYAVIFASLDVLDAGAYAAAIGRLHDQGVDAVITAVPLADPGERVAELLAMVPAVGVDEVTRPDDGELAVDQRAAAQIATDHLLELGHRTVWHVAGPSDWAETETRVRAWRETLTDHGVEAPAVLHGDWSAASGHRCGAALARTARADPASVTAVMVSSDEMAFGVISALSEAGLRVPEDVSVVGIDDIELAAFCSPPLTTVRQAFGETGRRAVRRIVALLDRPGESPPSAGSVRPELIVRASTAAPRR